MISCKVCTGNSRAAVDAALAAGQSVRQIARAYGFSKSSVARHRQNCKPGSPQAHDANATPDSAANTDIAAEISRLRRAQATARRKGDAMAQLAFSRELRAWVALQAKGESATLGRPREEPVSHREAIGMAKVLIEAEVRASKPEIIAWLKEIVSWLQPDALCDAPEETELPPQ